MSAPPESAPPANRNRLTLPLALSVTVAALAIMVVWQRLENERLSSQASPSPSAQTSPDAQRLNQSMAEQLARVEASLGEAQRVLAAVRTTDGTAPALVASAQIRPLPAAAPHQPTTAAPLVILSTNRFGGVTERRVFAVLPGADGHALARNAEFSRAIGRRLFFRALDAPPFALDVDQLHPDALHYLGIDAAQAKVAQAELDRSKQLAAERAEKERQEYIKAEREHQQALQKALVERVAKQPAISGEQLVTLAALRAAESANYRPQTAPQVIVVQQPQPVWNSPVIWYPHSAHQHRSHFQFANPAPVFPQTTVSSSSSFRFIQQQDNPYDPYIYGRRL